MEQEFFSMQYFFSHVKRQNPAICFCYFNTKKRLHLFSKNRTKHMYLYRCKNKEKWYQNLKSISTNIELHDERIGSQWKAYQDSRAPTRSSSHWRGSCWRLRTEPSWSPGNDQGSSGRGGRGGLMGDSVLFNGNHNKLENFIFLYYTTMLNFLILHYIIIHIFLCNIIW